jgi:hypothetical protein
MPKPIKATQFGIEGIAEDQTVVNIKRTRDRVRAIFDKYPETRNSRELLQVMYLLEFDDLDVLLEQIASLAREYPDKDAGQLRRIAVAHFKAWWTRSKTNLRNLWNRANEVQNAEAQYAPSPEVRAQWDKQSRRDPYSF